MEKKHIRLIKKNHMDLIKYCDFPVLLNKLVEKKIFSREIATSYETFNQDNKRKFLFDILGRGPTAYDNFVSALKETEQQYLADKLLGITDNCSVRNHSTLFQPPYHKNFYMQNEPLQVKVIHSSDFKDNFTSVLSPYTMRSKNRGAVLIINNKNYKLNPRKGAEVDEANLQALFKQMGGYNITFHEDLTSEDMKTVIINFANNPKLKQVDVMFVIIMSHGQGVNNTSSVECIDNILIGTSWIEEQFYNNKCSGMIHKPKIIIYQICRGVHKDYGVNAVETDGYSNIPTRTLSDILVCHSTCQGYKAHRDTSLGAWYIQSICEHFMNYAHSYHVADLLSMVDDSLRTWGADINITRQTANFYNMGFRHCYLNPGIYEENSQKHSFNIVSD